MERPAFCSARHADLGTDRGWDQKLYPQPRHPPLQRQPLIPAVILTPSGTNGEGPPYSVAAPTIHAEHGPIRLVPSSPARQSTSTTATHRVPHPATQSLHAPFSQKTEHTVLYQPSPSELLFLREHRSCSGNAKHKNPNNGPATPANLTVA